MLFVHVYNTRALAMAMTHSPETDAESRLRKIVADFWTVCHRHNSAFHHGHTRVYLWHYVCLSGYGD